MKILFTVCGRAGSKGIKNKNLRQFCGKPLAYYTISAIDLYIKRHPEVQYDVVANSDSLELLKLLTDNGMIAVDTIVRDASLSGDSVGKIDVIKDCLEKMKEHLAIVDRMLKSCRDDIRNCIWDLRANSLDQRSLDQAITLALDPHIGNVALKVNFNVSRSRISEPALHVLIRIVRELAINAIRHGNATEMMVVGGIEDNKLVCSVSDNGCGFDPQSVPGVTQGHFGLQGVRERVRSLGGSLTIESSPGRGTRVVVRLNLLCALEDSLP